MIAGGASFAPRRWSLVAEATDARSSPGYWCTARMTAAQNTRNCAFSCGVSPGTSRLPSVAVAEREVDVLARAVDALRTASRGTGTPCRASWRCVLKVVISSCWWSAATLAALEHRRDLELPGCDLVVPGLGRDAELEQLALGVHHEAQHALGDGAEVVVVELLALRRLGAEQRATGVEQVGAGEEEVPVDEEVLLLGAAERHDVIEVRRARTASGRAAACCPSPAANAAAASCGRAPRRSSTRTRSGCTACCRSGSPGRTPGS